eukprot:14283079-Ditylum_brightwellii.AAC.1
MAANAQGIVPNPASLSKVKTEERNAGGNTRNKRRDQNRRRYNNNFRRITPRVQNFEGRTAKLKWHIYDISYTTHVNQFITTMRELAEYVGRTCTHSGAISLAIIKQEDPVFNLPTLDSSISGPERRAVAENILAKEYDLYVKRKATYLDNKTKMYAIAYGQC